MHYLAGVAESGKSTAKSATKSTTKSTTKVVRKKPVTPKAA